MLVVITGPSGVGKTTIIKLLLGSDPGLQYSTSLTSRQPRSDEIDGTDYRFISPEEFQEKIKNDEFVEWSEVYGKYYGRLRKDLEDLIRCGDALIGIDVQGAVKLQAKYPEGVFIFMSPRSEAALEAQLKGRKTDDDASIKIRLAAALQEMKQADDFDYVVVNDKIDETVKEVQSILSMERGKSQK
ncbi:guanylate kinase [Candidatus Poribacteria bacterium]